MQYKMYYVSGGGTHYDGGEWDVVETPKTITFKETKKSFFESACPKLMRISKTKERSHCLRDWEDGSYTVYPFQSGTPHVYTPVDNSNTD